MTTPTPDIESMLAQVEQPRHVQAPRKKLGMSPAVGADTLDVITTHPLDDAPTDGSRVWLQSPDGIFYEAWMRQTRGYMPGIGWTEKRYWAIWQSTAAIGFEPIGWTGAD
jgi:hypothetical protein